MRRKQASDRACFTETALVIPGVIPILTRILF